jgi:hypothetical protein
MLRHSSLLAASILAGCASGGSQYNVDFRSLSSRLYVEGQDGAPVPPLGGKIVGILGVNIGSEAISIVPGTHWVRTSCQPGPDSIVSTHGQSVEHEFVVGKAYILRCKAGYPVIEPYE